MNDEVLMQRARSLAEKCATAGVLENQIANVLAHLKRHRDPAATSKLLDALKTSPFATRSKSSRRQLTALADHLKPALASARDWREAAPVVGWAKRLSPIFRRRSY